MSDVQAVIRRLWNAGMTLDQIQRDPRVIRTGADPQHVSDYYDAIASMVGVSCLSFSQLCRGLDAKPRRSIPFTHVKFNNKHLY